MLTDQTSCKAYHHKTETEIIGQKWCIDESFNPPLVDAWIAKPTPLMMLE